MSLNRLSQYLYQAVRASRDANAVLRGPKATGRRIVNKAAYRETNKLLARAIRAFWR